MSAIQRFIASQGREVASLGLLKQLCVIGTGFCGGSHSSPWPPDHPSVNASLQVQQAASAKTHENRQGRAREY